MKVVFFGTGPVASRTLSHLSKHFEIEAVITKPIPAHHKASFPVHDVARSENLKIIECKDKKELDDLVSNNKFESKIGLVVDYGIIISQKVIDAFPLGIVNSHFSLLPKWRGADPITFALLSGQEHTGVSLMLIVEKLDEGPLLAQEKYKMKERSNIIKLTQGLTDLSIKMLLDVLPEYTKGRVMPYPQDNKIGASYSRFITKGDATLDLTKPAEVLEREVRAYLGWPGTKTTLKLKDGSELKITITEAQLSSEDDNSPLTLKTSKDYLKITKLKLPGKNEMTAKDFLNGYRTKLN